METTKQLPCSEESLQLNSRRTQLRPAVHSRKCGLFLLVFYTNPLWQYGSTKLPDSKKNTTVKLQCSPFLLFNTNSVASSYRQVYYENSLRHVRKCHETIARGILEDEMRLEKLFKINSQLTKNFIVWADLLIKIWP